MFIGYLVLGRGIWQEKPQSINALCLDTCILIYIYKFEILY